MGPLPTTLDDPSVMTSGLLVQAGPPGRHTRSQGDEAAAEQLVRLDAIARGDDKVRRLPAASPASDVSTAPSPAMGGWSSFDSAEASPAAAAGAPALSYPSVGSAGHADRTCRPCAFARSSAGRKMCASGERGQLHGLSLLASAGGPAPGVPAGSRSGGPPGSGPESRVSCRVSL